LARLAKARLAGAAPALRAGSGSAALHFASSGQRPGWCV
jgi:hypothetical protein